MKLLFLILTIIIRVNSNAQSLKRLLLEQHPHCQNVQVIRCRPDSNDFICILQYQEDWWEKLSIVNFEKGRINWEAKFDMEPEGHYIRSVKQVILKGFNNPIIEVYGETHYGNGQFYLYELEDRVLRLLLKTYAVDEHLDYEVEVSREFYSRLFKGGILQPIFKDLNSDGITDVKLSGTVQICLDLDNILEQYPAQKVFIYNKEKREFVEAIKERKGFNRKNTSRRK